MDHHSLRHDRESSLSRRALLQRAGGGMGALALAGLLQQEGLLSGTAHAAAPRDSGNALAPRQGHFRSEAKAVIWLFMNGGQSHVDTWDYKPLLAKQDGKELEGFDKNTGFFTEQVGPVMKSPFKFMQCGENGMWVSDIFPNISRHLDKIAFVHSCYSESNNHSPALFQINTGVPRMGRPCVGSWITYGLGSQCNNLPAFCVMYDPLDRGLPKGHASNWGSGFLPSVFQGTALKPKGIPIDNLTRPAELTDARQRTQLDLLRKLNGRYQQRNPHESDLQARIESFELAYRMQVAAPEAIDVTRETEATQKMYGLDNKKCAHFAKQCLVARRLVERGVRFVQIYSGGMENARSWDGHSDIVKNHGGFAAETDIPVAALLSDLQQRGLLESTLIIYGGEFGRLPIVQKGGTGRDHNPHAFTTWFAGGGVKGGVRYGETDEIGHKAVTDRVSVHDLHATILHLLGMDHERLTYRFNGRDYRLTDLAGEVIEDILA